jgi:hypothetical protein
MPAFTAGIVLLLNIWGGKRSGLYTDPQKEMADVHKCMAMLKSCEKRSVDFFLLRRNVSHQSIAGTPLVVCGMYILILSYFVW